LATGIYGVLAGDWRQLLVVLAVLLFLTPLFLGVWAGLFADPVVAILVFVSVIPAFVLAIVIRHADSFRTIPARPLAVTFSLGLVFAIFARLVETAIQPVFQLVPIVGTLLFYYLVVAPAEETSKWFAVWTYGYRTDYLETAIDGAVFGAFAGLGFATVENLIYVVNELHVAQNLYHTSITVFVATSVETVARSFAGPGHVVYAGFSGYYLGLAKLDPDDRGPIIVKGLLIAWLIHATYDSLVAVVPKNLLVSVPFMVLYIGFFFALLYRKLRRCRSEYRNHRPEGTEA
jgi:protease PrsW